MAELVAEPFVSFVVEKAGEFLIQETRFLRGVRGQVQQLQNELELMQCFLKDAYTRQEGGDEIVRKWNTKIREAAYDAEDAIATYAVKVAFRWRGGVCNVIKRYLCIFSEYGALREVGLEIEAVNGNITSLTRCLQTYGIQCMRIGERSTSRFERQRQLRRSYSHVVEEDVVGIEDDVKAVVDQLVDEGRTARRVVSIWGMGGLGKTVLAKEVYNHSDIGRHFDSRAWTYISQQCKTREVWKELLSKLSPERERNEKLNDADLVRGLREVLSRKKCLVILDDIWDAEAWKSLEPGFPSTSSTDSGSKILLTTRKRDVALYVDPHHTPYALGQLGTEKSWELFVKKLSHREEFKLSPEMMSVGKEMIINCQGLPLAIVVLAGLLGTKHTLNEWEKVHKNIHYYLRKGRGDGGVAEVLALSYQDLPYHLKACFLYLSHLPEDDKIRPEKLVQMWMAEGIVSKGAQAEEVLLGAEETMLDFGMTFLGELVQRSMVQVQLTRFSRRIKFCRLHDLMRDLCLLKAQEENFFKVVRLATSNHQLLWPNSIFSSSSSSLATTTRRLALYYYGDRDIDGSTRQVVKRHRHIRSCTVNLFDNVVDKFVWQQIKSILMSFKLARVLDLQNILFSCSCPWEKTLPRGIGNLIHLRYFGIEGTQNMGFPYSIGNWRFLQTLDLGVGGFDGLTIPNVIWKLKQLRHLYLPSRINGTCSRGKLRLDGLSELETLEGFDPEYSDVKCFPTLTNLRKVSLFSVKSKDLIVILKSPVFSNSCTHLQKLSIDLGGDFHLEKEQKLLKQLLECHHLHKLYISGAVQKLPDQFPINLTNLELRKSVLEEDPMPTLEKFPNLRRLFLGPYSYTGEKMVCSAPHSTPTTTTAAPMSSSGRGGGFPQLKILRLSGLLNLEEWGVVEGAMPSLFRLEISHCPKLREIPEGLRFITTLGELEIFYSSAELEHRLRRGGADFYKIEHVPSVTILGGRGPKFAEATYLLG